MTNKYFSIGDSTEINKRKTLADKFCNTILDPEEIPFIITDDASLYDIYIGDENELIQRVKKEYNVILKPSDFEIPFWKLLDILETNKI